MVTIKEFRNPPRSLVARWSAELHLASKLQSFKDAEARGNNKHIIRVLGYGHEFLWGHESLEPHYFLVEEHLPNGNMGDIIYGIFPPWTTSIVHYELK
jgi:L1 cell adhesion molecule like protein